MAEWVDPAKRKPKPPPPDWKPAACADCGKPHPSHSRDGMAGPWRCADCDKGATPKPADNLFIEPRQGSLL